MRRRHVGLALAGLVTGPVRAAADLVVAQVSPMTGPLGPNGLANYIGAKAGFDAVNAFGGVNGSKVRFVRADDQYKPEETIRLLEEVARREKPVAFVNILGSANVTAVLKDQTLDRVAVPVIGVTPGAENLRQPGSPWLFHVCAGDKAQIGKILMHLSTVGISTLAVVYQDIPFGKNGLSFVDEFSAQQKLTVVGRVAVPSGAEDLKSAAAELRKSGAQTYLMILAPNSGTSLVRDVRTAGDRTPIYGMSYVPAKGIVDKSPAGSAVGVALAQVTPNAATGSTGLTRDFHSAMDKFAPQGTDHSQLHLIGYIAARAAVEALRKAGPSPSPARVAQAMKQVRVDLGGFNLDFSGSDNVGTQYVNIGVIDSRGRLTY